MSPSSSSSPRPPGPGLLARIREGIRVGIARVRALFRGGIARVRAALGSAASRAHRAVRSLRSPAVRESVLIGVAYVTGVTGLVVSVLGDPTNPESGYGAVGIGLMAVSFTCLFVVSVSILQATGGELGER